MKSERDSHEGITGVVTLNQNDVISGRGTLALKHPGNIAYRKFVREKKVLYATCIYQEKNGIAKSIVASIRDLNGRFLVREDGLTSSFADENDVKGNPVTWRDIGDKKAIEKTSQALREKSYKNKKAPKRDVAVNPMVIFNPIGTVHQSWIMPQTQFMFSPTQTLEETYASQLQSQTQSVAQVHMFGLEPPVQNALLPPQHQTATYPQNSSGENSAYPRSQSTEMWQDPWGLQNPLPCCLPVMEIISKRNRSGTPTSRTSNGSWAEEGADNNKYECKRHQNATYPQNSCGENSVDPRSQSTERMWQKSWGAQISLLHCRPVVESIHERISSGTSNSRTSHGSWTEEDPKPLPYQYHVGQDNNTYEHTFSADDCQELTSAPSLDREVRIKILQKLQGKSELSYLHLAKTEQLHVKIGKRLDAEENVEVEVEVEVEEEDYNMPIANTPPSNRPSWNALPSLEAEVVNRHEVMPNQPRSSSTIDTRKM